jgi:hypothetical protein
MTTNYDYLQLLLDSSYEKYVDFLMCCTYVPKCRGSVPGFTYCMTAAGVSVELELESIALFFDPTQFAQAAELWKAVYRFETELQAIYKKGHIAFSDLLRHRLLPQGFNLITRTDAHSTYNMPEIKVYNSGVRLDCGTSNSVVITFEQYQTWFTLFGD